MIQEALSKLGEGKDLSEEEAYLVNQEIMSGSATEAQIGAFLLGLRIKGETVDEVVGMARAMRDFSIRIRSDESKVVDTCGTGGDGKRTFNISTATALVVAGAGLKVAKHGNRSVSSHCGSADVLEAAGVKIDLPPEKARECLREVGMAFLFAPLFHPAMKHVVKPRREIGLRTVFNLLGPLTNPAGATHQLLGVCSLEAQELIAQSLLRLGVERATVVYSFDGLDEVSISAPTRLIKVEPDRIKKEFLDPAYFGLKDAPLSLIQTSGLEENLALLRDFLEGVDVPVRDAVLLNSAVALETAGEVSSVKEGLDLAAEVVDSGKAREKLESLINFCRRASCYDATPDNRN